MPLFQGILPEILEELLSARKRAKADLKVNFMSYASYGCASYGLFIQLVNFYLISGSKGPPWEGSVGWATTGFKGLIAVWISYSFHLLDFGWTKSTSASVPLLIFCSFRSVPIRYMVLQELLLDSCPVLKYLLVLQVMVRLALHYSECFWCALVFA